MHVFDGIHVCTQVRIRMYTHVYVGLCIYTMFSCAIVFIYLYLLFMPPDSRSAGVVVTLTTRGQPDDPGVCNIARPHVGFWISSETRYKIGLNRTRYGQI